MSEHDYEGDADSSTRGNRPVAKLRDGALNVSIFRNAGENGDRYAMVPGRTYTNEETGEVKDASSLSGSEALRMARLLSKSYDRVGELKAEGKQERTPANREEDRER